MLLSTDAINKYLDSIPVQQETAENLIEIKAWCYANISQDNLHTQYADDFNNEYDQCVHLIEMYLDFLAHYEQQPGNLVTEIKDIGLNLIQLAAKEGYDRFLEALTVSQAIINQRTAAGSSALALAASYGHRAAVEVLLTKGADVNQPNKNNELPSYNALILSMDSHEDKHARQAIFKVLAKNSSDTYTNKNIDRETVFHAMASQGYSDLLKESLRHYPQGILCANINGRYPAHIALLKPHDEPEILTLLLQGGVANKPDFKGQLPLHYAARYDASPAQTSICISQTENLDTKDNKGRTPMMLAVEAKNRCMIEALLDKKVDLSLRDENNKTSIDYAHGTDDDAFIAWFESKVSSCTTSLKK